MTKVIVLGHTGMLGEMVYRILSADPELEVIGMGREQLNALLPDPLHIDSDYVVNCIGIIKPYIKEDAEEAIRVNSLFPHLIQAKHIIQIATDCVFSGNQEIYDAYNEDSPHDALDIYGKTKSLGEVRSENFTNIRCSIIGPQKGNTSLLQWFLDLPQGAKIKGFQGHQWNGVTTLAFANICKGIIKGTKPMDSFHLVPENSFTKYQLLNVFKEVFDRPDIEIEMQEEGYCNRRLETLYPEHNEEVWKQGGYSKIPSIQELLYQLKEYI